MPKNGQPLKVEMTSDHLQVRRVIGRPQPGGVFHESGSSTAALIVVEKDMLGLERSQVREQVLHRHSSSTMEYHNSVGSLANRAIEQLDTVRRGHITLPDL